MRHDAPFIVEVTRGGAVESRHRVSAAVADADGRLYAAFGETDRPIYPRSAVKPLQALPLVTSGAADALGLTAAELALACGSHQGTPRHVEVAEAMMQRTGVSFAEISCGAHPPYDSSAHYRLIQQHESATVLHHNCIGKHLGMIATARYLKEPVRGYVEPDHPVQRRIHALFEVLGGRPLSGASVGVDGCSAPTFALPLQALARAFARLGAPNGLEPSLASACRRVVGAMVAEPVMVAGNGRLSTDVISGSGGAIVLKEGAEGVVAAALPAKGLGLALKVEDGAGRAAEVGMIALLRLFGAFTHETERKIRARFEPEVRTVRGAPVGVIRPAGGWLRYE